MTTPFWTVWGTGGLHRFKTRDEAERFARERALRDPGTNFYVTEAVSHHVKGDVSSRNLRFDDDYVYVPGDLGA